MMVVHTSDEKENFSSQSACDPASEGHQGWAIGPLPIELLDRPLDFFLADHGRQRHAALLLTRISGGEFSEPGIRGLVDFLEDDFARHVADEELVFFPALKACCDPSDEIDSLIMRLENEHRDDETIGDEVVELLRKRIAGSDFQADELSRIRHFAEHIHQHLAMENAVLLPIARARMNDVALKELSNMLKARRRRD